MRSKIRKKVFKPSNPLNVFITLAIISVLVAVVVLILNYHYALDGKEKPVMDEYKMKVIIKNGSINDYNSFTVGEEFVLSDKNIVLGNVGSAPYYAENIYGFFVEFDVSGTYNRKDGFFLYGNLYIAPGNEFRIHNGESSHIAEIYSIEKIK